MNNIEIPGVRYKWFPYSQVDNVKICDGNSLMECPHDYDSVEEVENLYCLQIDGFLIHKNGMLVLTKNAVRDDYCRVFDFDVIEITADGYFVGCEFRMPKLGIKDRREGVYFVPGPFPDVSDKLRFHDEKNYAWNYEKYDPPVEE